MRAVQALLRTLTSRWGMALGKLQPNWLLPISHEEFRRAAGSAAEDPAACNSEEPAPTRAPTPRCAQAAPIGEAQILLQLRPDFDARSRALLAELRTQVTC